MRRDPFKRGFTLMEINLAIFVMATGVLSVCVLYSLGFRENRQSVEDVVSVGYADAYLAPLIQGLSATNMAWTTWVNLCSEPANSSTKANNVADGLEPANGWADYVEDRSSEEDYQFFRFRVKGDPSSKADAAANKLLGKVPGPRGSLPTIPFPHGFVATRRGTVIQLAFRVAKRRDMLFSGSVFVADVHFQGDPEK